MATYSWLSLAAGISALQARLNNSVFWSSPELQSYLTQALREWSAYTGRWPALFNFPSSSTLWYNTGTLAGSPRLRTVTDQSLYNQMCYMLLEPQLSAGAWAGTNQFTLTDLQLALQRRTQEVIQATGCNLSQLSPLATTPGLYRTELKHYIAAVSNHRVHFFVRFGHFHPRVPRFHNPCMKNRIPDVIGVLFFRPPYPLKAAWKAP